MSKTKSQKNRGSAIETPLFWPAKLKGKALWVLDETLIPKKLKYIKVTDTKEAVAVIRQMKTRAFGQLLVVLNTFLLEIEKNKFASNKKLWLHLKKTAQALNKSRPTFPFSEVTGMVLHWARQALGNQENIKDVLKRNIHGYLDGIRVRRLERIARIVKIIKRGDCILTHCNVSGELAMAAAMCRKLNKPVRFFATETRPYMQGAKLTCWELRLVKADVTLVGDNAVGSLMADRIVNKVIVGSDRNCANGDFANKIGTYQLAVLAKEFGIPFYVLTQPSQRIRRGEDIPVEIRDEKELLTYNRKRFSTNKMRGFYPGFDIVPKRFITEAIAIHVN